VFEDSTAGVEAGRKAGMHVVWVPHPQLLNVYRGSEKVVLAGATEQLKVPQEVDHLKVVETNSNSQISEDGWAEMLTTLQSFPYERFGLHLED
jgi:pseudouridine-5'-monophosphatase